MKLVIIIMRKIKESTLNNWKQNYISKCKWSDNIKTILHEIDFRTIVKESGAICENIVRKTLVQYLQQHNYSAKQILDILVNQQDVKNTVLGYFFKTAIFNDPYFSEIFKEISKKIGAEYNIQSCPFYIMYFQHKYHKCKMCDMLTLRVYCSQTCMGKDPERTKRFKANVFSDEANQHRKQTCLKKYGTTNVLCNGSAVLESIRKNNIQKFGGKNPMNGNSPSRRKAQQTMLEKYGVAQFNNLQKRIATNLKNLGVAYNTQQNFKNYEKLNKEYVEINFIKEGRFFLQEFQEFFNLSQTVAYRYKKIFGIYVPNFIQEGKSKPQLDLYDSIKTSNKLYNDRTIISPLELDIVLPSIKLAIEYDGTYWHSLGDIPKTVHLNKTELCENAGYQLFHIFEHDDIEIWKSMIDAKLGNAKTIYARNCNVEKIENTKAKAFCDINHLQGGINSKYNFGLFYENKLVAVMTFGKSRYNKQAVWELLRFCQLKNHRIIGGAGKLLAAFRKENSGSIISYANRRWSNGNLYKALGFSFVKYTVPGFVYTKNSMVYSRISLQKHKLTNMASYNSQYTADKILSLEGYTKLYDCGNSVWIMH